MAWTREGAQHLSDFHCVVRPWGGSSGLLATRVAVADLNSPKVVLCGVPQDDRAHFDRPGKWRHADSFVESWEAIVPRIRDRVRSMSGWTREVFGAPTREWLEEI